MPRKLTPSDFEILRQKNLADNKIVLAKLLEELKEMSPLPLPSSAKKPRTSVGKAKRRDSDTSFVIRKNPRRSTRFSPMQSPPNTRSRSRRGSLSSEASSASDGSAASEGSRLLVRFGAFGKPRCRNENDEYSEDEESEDEEEKERRRSRGMRSKFLLERVVRDAKDISENDLEMVADSVKDKEYDSYHGSSCHQCRQKTIDQKTICRGEKCWGVRGQFCGPCLRNRYGEDARVALKDQNWTCPPCRGICNCSFCRAKKGKCATGILIHLAKEMGFDNVNAYLESLKKKVKAKKEETDE